jgi:hypothetical protein
MDEIVQLEFVDLARIELGEAVLDVLEQRSQMFLVVGADYGQRLPPLRPVARSLSGMGLLGHGDERTSSPPLTLANG